MRILKKFKKRILLTIFSIIFSVIALNQTGSAITLTPTKQYYVEWNSSTYNMNDLQIGRESGTDTKVSFLQFDTTNLKGLTLTSSTLRLTKTGGNGGTASLYYVFNTQNSWITNPTGTYNTTKQTELIGASPTALVSVAVPSNTTYSFSSAALLSALQTSIDIPDNTLFSLVLRESTNDYEADFQTGTGTTGPKLDVEGYPVPEPSSMILGLIGLGGVIGFRKNRGKLS